MFELYPIIKSFTRNLRFSFFFFFLTQDRCFKIIILVMHYESVSKQKKNQVMLYFFQHLEDSPLQKCAGRNTTKTNFKILQKLIDLCWLCQVCFVIKLSWLKTMCTVFQIRSQEQQKLKHSICFPKPFGIELKLIFSKKK